VSKNSKQSNKRTLALQLTRNVQIKRYPVIAKVTFQRARPDLVSLLVAMEKNADTMPPRLKAYLKNEKLWDAETSSLTDKGLDVKESGLYSVTERGLYHIWYINNDLLLGTRPVLMQRDTAFFEPSLESNKKGWLKGSDAARSSYCVDSVMQVEMVDEVYDGQRSRQEKQTMSLVKIEPEVICSDEKSSVLELNWSLSPSSSKISLNGQLDVLDFSQKKPANKPEKLSILFDAFSNCFHSVINDIIERFEGVWDESDQRMAVNLEQVQQYPKAVDDFIIGSRNLSKCQSEFGIFDSVKFTHLPIKPAERLDAEQWHQKWLEDFYRKSYQTSQNARQQQALWLDHTALIEFELPLKDASSLLDTLDREQQPEAFWHVAAMSDLTPSKSKKLRFPISLMNGDPLLLKPLLRQLTAGEEVKYMIYSDRYVHTARQSRNLVSVAACTSDAQGLLLTLEPQRGNEADLPDNWERVVMKKQNDNHGRYWLFVCDSNIYCWECSSGLDFIREFEGGYTVDGTPGFTPKEEHELPTYLQNVIATIKQSKTMEVA